MSVRTGDRTEGQLEVLNRVRELKAYTLKIVRNEKIFPKSTRWLYASPIAQEVRNASVCIRHANTINLEEEYELRRQEQYKARASLAALYDLVEDAMLANYIAADRCEYWTGLIKKSEEKLIAWMKSDKQRMRNYFAQG